MSQILESFSLLLNNERIDFQLGYQNVSRLINYYRNRKFSIKNKISIFDAVNEICVNCDDNDVIVSDAGSSYYVTSMMFTKFKTEYNFWCSGRYGIRPSAT